MSDQLAYLTNEHGRCPTTIAYLDSNGHHDCGLPAGHLPAELHQCSVCGLTWPGLSLAQPR